MIYPFAQKPDQPKFSRSTQFLLVSSFVSSLGVFLVSPYLATHLVAGGQVTVRSAGAYLGLMYWCLTAGSILAGALVQRFGLKTVMTVGLLLRLPGYLLFLVPGTPWTLICACVITGLGGALYFPTSKTALLLVTAKDQQLRALSTRSMCANSGVALGPVIGAGLLAVGSDEILLVSAALAFTALALFSLRLPLARAETAVARTFWSDLRHATRIPGVKSICLVSLAYGAVYIQFESTIPLHLNQVNRASLVTAVFVINAIVVVATQSLAVLVLERSPTAIGALTGFGFYAVGFGAFMLPLGWSVAWLVGVAVFSFGEVVTSLMLDYEVAKTAPDNATTVFGLSRLANAGGGAAGSWLGAMTINAAHPENLPLTWGAIAAATGLAGVFSATFLLRSTSRRAQPLYLTEVSS